MWNTYHTMQNLFAPFHQTITEIEMNSRHTWQLKLNDEIVIKLGRDNILEKGRRLQRSFNKINLLNDKPVKVYDLRYANGIVISH